MQKSGIMDKRKKYDIANEDHGALLVADAVAPNVTGHIRASCSRPETTADNDLDTQKPHHTNVSVAIFNVAPSLTILTDI